MRERLVRLGFPVQNHLSYLNLRPKFGLHPNLRIEMMFVTEPTHELPFPTTLGTDGSKYWRALRLSVHRTWYLLTMATTSPGEGRPTTSLCLAWDTDVVELLTTDDAVRPLGLALMTPGRSSPTGHWSSHEIHEVWAGISGNGRRLILFRDHAGAEYADGHRLAAGQSVSDRYFIARVEADLR